MTIAELREEAKKRGLKGVSALKKAELLAVLQKEGESEKAKKTAAVPSATRPARVEAAARPAQQAPAGMHRPQTGPAQTRRPAPAPARNAAPAPAPTPMRSAAPTPAPSPAPAVRPAPTPAPVQKAAPADDILEAAAELNSMLGPDIDALDSGLVKTGILEVMADGYGFIRCDNFLPGTDDVYLSPSQIRKFNLKTGDIVTGNMKVKSPGEKYQALLYIKSVNGLHPSQAQRRPKFENLTPIFPNRRIHLETPGCSPAMRIVDIISPIGKGQRGMIVS